MQNRIGNLRLKFLPAGGIYIVTLYVDAEKWILIRDIDYPLESLQSFIFVSPFNMSNL